MIKKREPFLKKASPKIIGLTFNKKENLREKAGFLIIILICSIFSFGLNTENAEAQSSRTSSNVQQACCEKTKSGDYCVYTDKNECDTANGLGSSYTRCEETNYCSNVCCADQNGCYPNTPSGICKNRLGNSFSDASCNSVNGCRQGCCVIGNNYIFNSEIECKNLANNVLGNNYNLNNIFKSAGNERECLDLSLKDQEGCCVDNNQCSYGKKSDCDGEFNLGKACSQVNECKNQCSSKYAKGCKDGNVYWLDSCGSAETLVEECNYEDGKLCAEKDKDAFCRSVDCEKTTKYDNWDYTGGVRKNGEAWCIYDGPTGNFTDRPGSRHYKFGCVDGEEILLEECAEFRKEICVQANEDEFSQASCIKNEIYNSPINRNISSVAVGFDFWKDNEDNKEQCNKGTTRCTVVYVKDNRLADWECEGNCFCESQEFIDQANTYCKSYGDCGFSYNVLEKDGSAGLNIYWTGADLGDQRNTLSQKYKNELKKYGIFGGMEFLSAESERFLDNFQLFQTDDDIFEQVLIYGSVGFFVLSFGGTAILLSSAFVNLGLFSLPVLGSILSGGVSGVATAAGAASDVAASISSTAQIGTAVQAAQTAALLSTVTLIFAVVAAVAIIATAVLTIVYSGGGVREKTINIECRPWQAPLGGEDCGKCTSDPLKECTEYKCKSLGTSCELINEGTDKVECVDSNPNDITSPKLEPLILTQGYSTEKERLGYKVKEEIDPFKEFIFGIKTDEAAVCKYEIKVSTKYEEMRYDFGDSFFKNEHKLNLVLESDKEYRYYMRCADTKGNDNDADYLIKFKTKKGQDLTAPRIISTSIKNNGAVGNNITAALLQLEINEPGYCRWDNRDKQYDKMGNQSICTDQASLIPMKYNCIAAFTGLKQGTNTYYFRCNDLKGNNNTQSYVFNLIRSEPLIINIDPTSPKDLVYVNDITLAVNTEKGSENGKAICKYSQKDVAYEEMDEFKVTNSNKHLQSQTNLRRGNYDYYIRCRDSAGNEEKKKISFKIVLDKKGNEITNIYKDQDNLYVILDVASDCEYNDKVFVYGSGKKMTGEKNTVHTAPLEFNEYYIECKDDQGKDIKGLKINV